MKRSESVTDFGRGAITREKKNKANTNSPTRRRDVLVAMNNLEILDDNEENRRLIKRKTWTKSLRLDSADSSDNSIIEEKIKKENNLISTEGFIIESILDDPIEEDFRKLRDDTSENYYEQLLENFYKSSEDVIHYIYTADDILIVSVVTNKSDVGQVDRKSVV